jgi:hypothetical protein
MANVQRIEKAAEGKYEGNEYLSYAESADYLGIKRATLYNYVNDLDITTHKFKRNRCRYIAMSDVKRLEQIIKKPWLAGPDDKKSGDNSVRQQNHAA